MQTASPEYRERTLRDLASSLSSDVSLLVRQEAELAKAQIDDRLKRAKKDGIALGAGGAVAYTGVLALTAAVIAALAMAMPIWLSALLVGLVLSAAGGLMLRKATTDLAHMDAVPRASVESIKTDFRVLKETVR
jgi:hypothetical protein